MAANTNGKGEEPARLSQPSQTSQENASGGDKQNPAEVPTSPTPESTSSETEEFAAKTLQTLGLGKEADFKSVSAPEELVDLRPELKGCFALATVNLQNAGFLTLLGMLSNAVLWGIGAAAHPVRDMTGFSKTLGQRILVAAKKNVILAELWFKKTEWLIAYCKSRVKDLQEAGKTTLSATQRSALLRFWKSLDAFTGSMQVRAMEQNEEIVNRAIADAKHDESEADRLIREVVEEAKEKPTPRSLGQAAAVIARQKTSTKKLKRTTFTNPLTTTPPTDTTNVTERTVTHAADHSAMLADDSARGRERGARGRGRGRACGRR